MLKLEEEKAALDRMSSFDRESEPQFIPKRVFYTGDTDITDDDERVALSF